VTAYKSVSKAKFLANIPHASKSGVGDYLTEVCSKREKSSKSNLDFLFLDS